MQVTIIPVDGLVIVDGTGIYGIDMSTIPKGIHAVQWNGTTGEIEYAVGGNGLKKPNAPIQNLDDFLPVIDQWQAKRDAANTPPPEPTLTQLKRAKLEQINNAFEAAITTTKNGYPSSEMLTWDKQEKEAKAYLADQSASTPLIDALCAARSIEKADIVDRIMAKVTAAEAEVGTAIGKRQRLEDQLYAIADDDPDAKQKIAAISWDGI